jgi:tripartite-type tricarboxylate transporter receptor subunit TctC
MDRRMLVAALTSLAMLSIAGGASAQPADDFPNHPIRIIVPQAAGSGIDLQARTLAQKMSELLGQPGIVENRAGANAIIGTDAVAKAAPDGYTLVYAPVSAVTTNALIYKKLPYDPVRDFAPITQTVANPLGLIANPDSGINSIKDLVDRAKASPGKINFGSFGIGNLTHLQGVLLSLAAKIEMTHVPYRGQTPEVTDILAGQIPIGFTTTAGVSDLVESGKLKLLATFGAKRDELFPNTPTPTEAGYPSAVVVGWAGILAPGGTPKPIVDKLYAAFAKALAMPDVKEAILKQGSEPVASKSADDFREYVKAEIEKFRPVIKAAGLEGTQ